MRNFSRIERLPPYVFNITGELKMAARRRGEDIIDMSMGNPDGATPKHGYSISKGIARLRKGICDWYQRRYAVEFDPESEAIVGAHPRSLPCEGLAGICQETAFSRQGCVFARHWFWRVW